MRNALRYCLGFVACAAVTTLAFGAPKNSTSTPILYAASQGGLAPGDSAIYEITTKRVSVLAEDVGGPQKIDLDAEGNLFIADPSWDAGDRIWVIPRGGALTTFFEFRDSNGSSAGRANPYALTIAPNGSVIVAATPDYTVPSQTIYSIDQQAIATSIATVDGGAMGMSYDSLGNLYAAVTYFSLYRIVKVTPTGTVTVLYDGLPAMPWDAQIGPDGALYVAINQTSRIYRLDVSSATPALTVFADIPNPMSLAFDGAGYLYVGQGAGHISRVDPQGNVALIASGFRGTAVTGIAVSCPATGGKGKPKPCFSVRSPLTGP